MNDLIMPISLFNSIFVSIFYIIITNVYSEYLFAII